MADGVEKSGWAKGGEAAQLLRGVTLDQTDLRAMTALFSSVEVVVHDDQAGPEAKVRQCE
jgi:hypothetical protein